MTGRSFIQAGEVADRLAISRHSFLAKREMLARSYGFPEPMPHSDRPLLWRADEVDAWIDLNGRPRGEPQPPVGHGDNVILLAQARTA